jgi:transitional endoplasmic reticulum ATPase
MADFEPFTFVEESVHDPQQPALAPDYEEFNSARTSNQLLQIVTALRKEHPELILTTVPGRNVNLLEFAAAGFATAKLDTENEPVVRLRGYIAPPPNGGQGFLADGIMFAKYHYVWNREDFILYYVQTPYGMFQFILKEPRKGETIYSHSSVTDSLLSAIGAYLTREIPGIWVYDQYWTKSHKMWEEVQKSSWDNIILDEKMKKDLTEVTKKFFDSKDIYDDFGVPWKRGILLHGPPGNGKTITIKALMHTLDKQKIPSLYVRSAPFTYHIGAVFAMARRMAPCILILEDIETIVNTSTRSYFFNEVDGVDNNDGIFMVASTNFLDRLDPGLSKRPSRFDRLFKFDLPSTKERDMYCHYWYEKIKSKEYIDFPAKLCQPIASITQNFSFAMLKEAFVATLLALARRRADAIPCDGDDDDDGLEKYEFWRVIKE